MQISDDEGAAPPKTDTAQADALNPESQLARVPEECARLIHDLEVHQIELKLQNEELRRAQEELESSRARYFDLYDLAPVSYLTLSLQGVIQEANLTAATVLGVPRGALLGQPFARFIAPEDQDSYYLFRRGLVQASRPQGCELCILRPDLAPFWARLEAMVVPETADRAVTYRIIMSDITARKRAEQAVNRQLRSQVAVARCSRILLQPALTVEDQGLLLSSTLEALRHALGASYLGLAQNASDPQLGRCAHVIVGTADPDSPFQPFHPDLRTLPWSAVPAEIQHTFEVGTPWGGPLSDVIQPLHRPLLSTVSALGINALFCMPLFVAHEWWGLLLLADAQADRAWSVDETLLLTTVAELIGTAMQRWQTEANLALQLSYAEALSHCSQLLLQQDMSDAERRTHLESALTTLRETVGISRLYIYQPPSDIRGVTDLSILADSRAPDFVSYVEPLPEELRDTPVEIIQRLREGLWFGCRVAGRFPANPLFQRSFDKNGVQSMLWIPVHTKGKTWGILSATDRGAPRDWDESTVQMLRTAAEMIATFQKSWETTRALRGREHFIQRVMQVTPDVIHVYDLKEQQSLFVNRPLSPLVGYAPELVTNMNAATLKMLIHPDDYPQVMAHYVSVNEAADSQVVEFTYRARISDGSDRWILSRDQVFARDAAGRPLQILSVVQDITDRKATEQALVSSEAHLRALYDALPDMLCIISRDNVLIDYHLPPGIEMLIPPAQVIGRTIDTIIAAAIATRMLSASLGAQVVQICAQVRESGESAIFEYSLPEGERTCTYEARVVLVAGGDLLILARDITERREATEALMRAKESAEATDRAKSAFVAHISHELRTPLTAVIGMASLLRETALSPVQVSYTATIQTGAETLLHIIGNILDFSKIEAGQLDLETQPFDLRTCLDEALDLVRHTAEHKELRLSYMIDPGLPAAFVGDAGRLRQVFVNLLGNAVKFTERGAVSVTAKSRPRGAVQHMIMVVIADTGIGISADALPHIFEPFLQAKHTTTRHYGGTGLGLTISRQLIELMGGQLTVTSMPGVGSAFTLTLPLDSASSAQAPQPIKSAEYAPAAYRLLRILIAEDNPINQQVLSQMLQTLGPTPDVVGTGAAALAAVDSMPYDVVLMDIQMPEMDGEEATRQIRALRGIVQPTIIALTASALRGDRERYLAAGMDDYLSKPVQISDLRQLLAHATARRTPPSAPPTDLAARQVLVDWDLFNRSLASLGVETAQAATIMWRFYQQLADQLTQLSAAVTAADRPLIRQLAHKLCGGSGQIGASALAQRCAEIEARAETDSRQALTQLLHDIRATYDQTLAQVALRLTATDEGTTAIPPA